LRLGEGIDQGFDGILHVGIGVERMRGKSGVMGSGTSAF
jgi:hypothetical protein